MCSYILTGITQFSVGIALLTSQSLGQLVAGEIAQTTDTNHLVEHFQVGVVGSAEHRLTTLREGLHLNFVVLEVGLLQNNGSTVRELQLLIAKRLVLSLADNLTSLDLGNINQWLVLYIVNVCLNLISTGSSNGSSHILLCRINLAFLLLSPLHHNEVAVGSRNQLGHHLVDGLHRNIESNLLHNLIEHIQWWDRLVVEIVVTISIAIFGILALVAVGIALLQSTQIVGTCTVIL